MTFIFRFLFLTFFFNYFSVNLLAITTGDSVEITVVADNLSYSEMRSLMDKNIKLLISTEINSSDFQTLVSLDPNKVVIDGRGFDYIQLNSWLSSGAAIILDRTFSNFDCKALTSTGRSDVFIYGTGFDMYDLELFLNNGANLILDNTFQYSYLYSIINKYPNRIYINNKGFSTFVMNDLMTLGVGVWISTSNYISDTRKLIELSSRYGGGVFIGQKLSYFDIKMLVEQ